MELRRVLLIAVVLATTALLVPWVELLFATWNGDSKAAAPSMLACAAAVVLAWRDRVRLASLRRPSGSVWPVLGCAASACVYAVAVVCDVRLVAGVAAVTTIASLIWTCAGWPVVRAVSMPLVLLAFATPMPAFVEAALTRGLVAATVAVTPTVLSPFTGPIETEGAVLFMSGGSVTVVDDCSGLGGILLFAPFACVLLALRGPNGPIRSGLVLAVAAFCAFGASLGRVWVSALLVQFGSSLADSETAHEVLGIVTLLLALAVLVRASDRILAPREDVPRDATDALRSEGVAT